MSLVGWTNFYSVLTVGGGPAVGGSTLINGLTYGRGSASINDLWHNSGNHGWDWASMLRYLEKVSPPHTNMYIS